MDSILLSSTGPNKWVQTLYYKNIYGETIQKKRFIKIRRDGNYIINSQFKVYQKADSNFLPQPFKFTTIAEFLEKDSVWENPWEGIYDFVIKGKKGRTPRQFFELLGKRINFDVSQIKKISDFTVFLKLYLKKEWFKSPFMGWFLKEHKVPFKSLGDEKRMSGLYMLYNTENVSDTFEIYPANKYDSHNFLMTEFQKKFEISNESFERTSNGISHVLNNIWPSHAGWKAVKIREYQSMYAEAMSFNTKKQAQISSLNQLEIDSSEPNTWLKNDLEGSQKIPNQYDNLDFSEINHFLMPITNWIETQAPEKLNNWNEFLKSLKEKEFPYLSVSCSSKQKQELCNNEIQSVLNIKTDEDIVDFFCNSSTLYYTICSWLVQNRIFSFNKKDQKQSHHIIPLYLEDQLAKKTNYKEIVDFNSNRIEVSYIIHMNLHLIRAIEFGYNGDKKVVKLAVSFLSEQPLLNSYETVLLLLNKAVFDNSLLDKKIKSSEQILERAWNYRIELQFQEEKEFYKQGFEFQNLLFDGIPNQIFKPGEVKDTRDITNRLKEVTINYLENNPDIEWPKNYEEQKARGQKNEVFVNYMRHYLFENLLQKNGVFWGWHLVKRPSILNQLAKKIWAEKIKKSTPFRKDIKAKLQKTLTFNHSSNVSVTIPGNSCSNVFYVWEILCQKVLTCKKDEPETLTTLNQKLNHLLEGDKYLGWQLVKEE